MACGCYGLLTGISVRLRLVLRKPAFGGRCDSLCVDLEEAPQFGPRIAAAKAVGSQAAIAPAGRQIGADGLRPQPPVIPCGPAGPLGRLPTPGTVPLPCAPVPGPLYPAQTGRASV